MPYSSSGVHLFTGRSVDKIKTDVQEKGDIGIVAEVSFKLLL